MLVCPVAISSSGAAPRHAALCFLSGARGRGGARGRSGANRSGRVVVAELSGDHLIQNDWPPLDDRKVFILFVRRTGLHSGSALDTINPGSKARLELLTPGRRDALPFGVVSGALYLMAVSISVVVSRQGKLLPSET